MEPLFFDSREGLYAWLLKHGDSEAELLLGFYKKNARQSGIAHADAIDEALCFSWIDGVVRRIDDERFSHRLTPRKAAARGAR